MHVNLGACEFDYSKAASMGKSWRLTGLRYISSQRLILQSYWLIQKRGLNIYCSWLHGSHWERVMELEQRAISSGYGGQTALNCAFLRNLRTNGVRKHGRWRSRSKIPAHVIRTQRTGWSSKACFLIWDARVWLKSGIALHWLSA